MHDFLPMQIANGQTNLMEVGLDGGFGERGGFYVLEEGAVVGELEHHVGGLV